MVWKVQRINFSQNKNEGEKKKMKKQLKYIGLTKTLYNKYQEVARKTGTDKNFMNKIYTHIAEQLFFVGMYPEEQIERFFRFQYEQLHPNYYGDEEHYTKYGSVGEYVQFLFDNMTEEQETNIQSNKELMGMWIEFEEVVNKLLSNSNDKDKDNGNDKDEETNPDLNEIISTPSRKQRITEILTQLDKGQYKRYEKGQLIVELVELLEQEEQMFMVDFPDERNGNEDGFKSKHYYINPETNSYERNTKKHLKELFNDKYHVKLHQDKKFYYNLLERVYNHKEEQPDFVELENVYINRLNYNILPKEEHNDIFTTDRLTYNTYETNELRLFEYTEGITLDDITSGKVEMTFPMKCVYEIFVPRTNPEKTNKLRMFLQYMGMMVIGRNPVKLLLLLYDLEDKRAGNKGRTTLFTILRLCFNNSFVQIGKEVFTDPHKIDLYKHGKHGLFMDETNKDTLTKHHTEIKGLVNGSGQTGGAMYTRDLINIESLPLLMGSNGLPDAPLFDNALLTRIVPIELPNKFVDDKEVKENTNTYPKITNIEAMILQHIEGLEQLISVAINEYKLLDLTKSLDGQLAIQPNVDYTIQVLTQNNIVFGLLKTYTTPVARGTNKSKDWITTDEIVSTISQAYKRATTNEIPPHEVEPKRIGELLKQIYNQFLTQTLNKKPVNKTTINGKTHYNLTLHTYEEIQQMNNEIMEVLPVGENQFLTGIEQTIYHKIQQGVNTYERLYEELKEDKEQIDDTLEELYTRGLVDWTGTQRLPVD